MKPHLVAFGLLLAACTSPTLEPPAPEPSGDAGPVVSVRPGINDDYFAPDGLANALDTLEYERREVAVERDAIVAALGVRDGMAIADVGAGTGLFMGPLSEAIGPTGTLYAIDIVPEFVAHLRQRVGDESLTNVEVVAATATDPSLAPGSVDLLFLCDVYHHIEYPTLVLPQLRRALRPEGRLVVIDFHRIIGKTPEGLIKHVRADQATFVREIEAAGFTLDRELGPADGIHFDQNYMLVFEPSGPKLVGAQGRIGGSGARAGLGAGSKRRVKTSVIRPSA